MTKSYRASKKMMRLVGEKDIKHRLQAIRSGFEKILFEEFFQFAQMGGSRNFCKEVLNEAARRMTDPCVNDCGSCPVRVTLRLFSDWSEMDTVNIGCDVIYLFEVARFLGQDLNIQGMICDAELGRLSKTT